MRDGVLVSEVRVRGPLAELAPGFAEFLDGRGYASGSAQQQLGLISQLSRWLEAEGLDVGGLTQLEAERFLPRVGPGVSGFFARCWRWSRSLAICARSVSRLIGLPAGRRRRPGS